MGTIFSSWVMKMTRLPTPIAQPNSMPTFTDCADKSTTMISARWIDRQINSTIPTGPYRESTRSGLRPDEDTVSAVVQAAEALESEQKHSRIDAVEDGMDPADRAVVERYLDAVAAAYKAYIAEPP